MDHAENDLESQKPLPAIHKIAYQDNYIRYIGVSNDLQNRSIQTSNPSNGPFVPVGQPVLPVVVQPWPWPRRGAPQRLVVSTPWPLRFPQRLPKRRWNSTSALRDLRPQPLPLRERLLSHFIAHFMAQATKIGTRTHQNRLIHKQFTVYMWYKPKMPKIQ